MTTTYGNTPQMTLPQKGESNWGDNLLNALKAQTDFNAQAHDSTGALLAGVTASPWQAVTGPVTRLSATSFKVPETTVFIPDRKVKVSQTLPVIGLVSSATTTAGETTVILVGIFREDGVTTSAGLTDPISAVAVSLVTPLSTLLAGESAIINGALKFWNRGTSFTSIADGKYTADRFAYRKSGTMVHDVSRSADVPTVAEAGAVAEYSLLADCTTADTSMAATDFCSIDYKIEGYDFARFLGRSGVLPFLVKATKTGTYCAAFQNSGGDRTFISEYRVNTADTWELKVIQIPFDYSGGTWDFTNGTGLTIKWVLAAGTNHHGTADQWNSSAVFATANQVNACDNIANNFQLALVKFEMGNIATPFTERPYRVEKALCERYFNVIKPSAVNGVFGTGTAVNTNYLDVDIFYPEMRSAPTVTLSAGNTFDTEVGGGINTGSSVSAANISKTCFRLRTGVAGTPYGVGQCGELRHVAGTTNASIQLEAEL